MIMKCIYIYNVWKGPHCGSKKTHATSSHNDTEIITRNFKQGSRLSSKHPVIITASSHLRHSFIMNGFLSCSIFFFFRFQRRSDLLHLAPG